jgi:hypothetical protein
MQTELDRIARRDPPRQANAERGAAGAGSDATGKKRIERNHLREGDVELRPELRPNLVEEPCAVAEIPGRHDAARKSGFGSENLSGRKIRTRVAARPTAEPTAAEDLEGPFRVFLHLYNGLRRRLRWLSGRLCRSHRRADGEREEANKGAR